MTEDNKLPWEQVGSEHKKSYTRAGMVLDLNRCVGCHSCSVSCKTEHSVPLGNFRMRVRYLERPDSAKLAFAPLMCMHCQDAPCMDACPSNAIKRLDDGRVVVIESKCDLEKECVKACPYGAISINEEKEKAEKCDFCVHRTEVGLEPACSATCPSSAIQFGDLDDPEDPISKLIKETNAKPWKESAGTKPSVYYIGHEKWMEEKVNTGVQLDPKDADITYEQNNLKNL